MVMMMQIMFSTHLTWHCDLLKRSAVLLEQCDNRIELPEVVKKKKVLQKADVFWHNSQTMNMQIMPMQIKEKYGNFE